MAWRATGLIPYNLTVVFQVHSKDRLASNINAIEASSNMPIQMQFFSGAILSIAKNIKQVTKVEELVLLFRDQTLDLPKLIFLHKTVKAAILAMANGVILNRTNTELLATNTQKNDIQNVPESNTVAKVLVF